MNRYTSWSLVELEAEHARLNVEKRKIKAELTQIAQVLGVKRKKQEAEGRLEEAKAEVKELDQQLKQPITDKVKSWLGH